jgi:phosphonate transport system substrate-binding protein
MGTVSFLTARDRGPVELVAVSEENGKSYYYSGLFALAESEIRDIGDVRGRTLVLSDPSSSSGFVYPLALIKKNGIEPIKDCARIILSGSHTNSLTTLAGGHAEIAAAPFESYLKAVRQGVIDPRRIRIIAKSDPIPNPPIAVSGRIDATTIDRLREAFHQVHTLPGIEPEMIRGHGGNIVDRYNAEVPESFFHAARENMTMINNQYRAEVLRRASER